MMRVYTDYTPGNTDNQKTPVDKFILYHPVPNPFTNKVRILFHLPEQKEIKLNVYDATGRMIKSLINGKMEKGRHLIIWNGEDNQNRGVSSGIYFIKADYANKIYTEKVILLK